MGPPQQSCTQVLCQQQCYGQQQEVQTYAQQPCSQYSQDGYHSSYHDQTLQDAGKYFQQGYQLPYQSFEDGQTWQNGAQDHGACWNGNMVKDTGCWQGQQAYNAPWRLGSA